MTELDTSIVQYDITDAAIAAMKHEYSGLTITDKESYEVVRQALGVVRGHRTAVDKRRLELTKKARDYQSEVNSAGKAIIASLTEIEEPLKATKKVEDDKEAVIEAEKAAIEEARKVVIMNRITAISDLNSPDVINMESGEIGKIRDSLIDLEIKGEEFEEFSEQAERIKANVLTVIQKALDERLVFEAAAVKAKEETERLTEEKKVQEAREKELAEREAEIKAKEDLANLEKIQEEARIQAEAIAKEKVEREELEAKEREEAEAAEAARQEALKPDKTKLEAFADFIFKINGPDLQSKEAVDILNRALTDLNKIWTDLKSDIENL